MAQLEKARPFHRHPPSHIPEVGAQFESGGGRSPKRVTLWCAAALSFQETLQPSNRAEILGPWDGGAGSHRLMAGGAWWICDWDDSFCWFYAVLVTHYQEVGRDRGRGIASVIVHIVASFSSFRFLQFFLWRLCLPYQPLSYMYAPEVAHEFVGCE